MKKLTFKVSTQKDFSVISLIKEINNISCQINLDFENGIVTVINVNELMIDTVIDLVNNYYSILSVDIDNTDKSVAVSAKVTEKITASPEINATAEVKTESKPSPKTPVVVGPQTEDDLIIEKVKFANEYIEELVNKFLRTTYWAMFKKAATEKDIEKYIFSAMSELSWKYGSPEIVEFSIGDIVDCNYGAHLPIEISGGHVHAIVCDIARNGSTYLIPITKSVNDIYSDSFISFQAPKDVIYFDNSFTGGSVLLEKSSYVAPERINAIVGTVKPHFFAQVLKKLSSTFDFTGNIDEAGFVLDDDLKIPVEKSEKVSKNESEVSTDKKISGMETNLLELIGPAFDKLDKSLTFKEQICEFMSEIGIPATATLVAQSFEIACDVKKVNYENIIFELHKLNPDINKDVIKASLKETFKTWLEKHPELIEKYPNISLMSILKVFSKRFSKV